MHFCFVMASGISVDLTCLPGHGRHRSIISWSTVYCVAGPYVATRVRDLGVGGLLAVHPVVTCKSPVGYLLSCGLFVRIYLVKGFSRILDRKVRERELEVAAGIWEESML